MTLKEKRLEEFEKRYPGMLMTGDESGGHDAKPYILDSLSDSIDMAYEEGKQQMADNIVEIIENEKEKGYEDRQILEGILTRCKVAVKLWD